MRASLQGEPVEVEWSDAAIAVKGSCALCPAPVKPGKRKCRKCGAKAQQHVLKREDAARADTVPVATSAPPLGGASLPMKPPGRA